MQGVRLKKFTPPAATAVADRAAPVPAGAPGAGALRAGAGAGAAEAFWVN